MEFNFVNVTDENIAFFHKVMEEVRKAMADCSHWSIIGVTTQPLGHFQDCERSEFFTHEWCDQRCLGEDFYQGEMYFPIGQNTYVVVEYQC